MEAWPFESTNRSRLGQIGSFGSNRISRFQIVYTNGASAIGVPGCPDLACCTASMESVRIVLMHSSSMPISDATGTTCVTLMFDLLTNSLVNGLRFKRGHLTQPADVAFFSGEPSYQEGIHKVSGNSESDDPAAHTEDVHIVM